MENQTKLFIDRRSKLATGWNDYLYDFVRIFVRIELYFAGVHRKRGCKISSISEYFMIF